MAACCPSTKKWFLKQVCSLFIVEISTHRSKIVILFLRFAATVAVVTTVVSVVGDLDFVVTAAAAATIM